MENKTTKYTDWQLFLLAVLRMAIGWHFLYEGIHKLTLGNWTAAPFLIESKWLFSAIFHSIAANPSTLAVVDQLNIWGLIFIGLGLISGLLTRISALAGIALLSLYYIANPPLVGLANGGFTEGNYLVIDKNLIEMIALLVLTAFPSGSFGFDRLLSLFRSKTKVTKKVKAEKTDPAIETNVYLPRRELLKNMATLPVFGAFIYAYLKKQGWESWEEKHLKGADLQQADATSGATVKTFQFSSLKDLKGQVPKGKIGDLEVSRLFMGGNLIGGWAHSRDLIYVSKLVKSYHSDQKVFDTLQLAEQCGINTLLTNPQLSRVINAYWRKTGGKMQYFSDCGLKGDSVEGAKVSIDNGAHACYVQGEIADKYAATGQFDKIAETLEITRKAGLPAGIGAHQLITVQKCVEQGLKPDFWVKTLHHTNYWSANKENQHDNIWCVDPAETIAFMEAQEEPWIAFKTLAAGAIHPDVGFPYAFENGADFLCVGMYDFQVVDDVNIAIDALANLQDRKRPWRA